MQVLGISTGQGWLTRDNGRSNMEYFPKSYYLFLNVETLHSTMGAPKILWVSLAPNARINSTHRPLSSSFLGLP